MIKQRQRLDVRRMLLARGWTERGTALLIKDGASVAYHGDVFLSGPARRGRGRFTCDFPSDTPARVIVAAAEAAAEIERGGSDA